jgi:7-carboxy-7-deazaguanine synthase
MPYTVKEMYLTLQGEGRHAGRVAVFVRFAGCNLWSGREADRATAVCQFCDTQFVGTDGVNGGKFSSATDLVRAAAALWPGGGDPYVVCTGGEPLLQLDVNLVDAFHDAGFAVAVETNGTRTAPPGIDWVCVSPKAGATLVLTRGDELKLVYPQAGVDPAQYTSMAFHHFYLQPMDGPDAARAMRAAIEYCLHHPKWKLSVQTHKILGIP